MIGSLPERARAVTRLARWPLALLLMVACGSRTQPAPVATPAAPPTPAAVPVPAPALACPEAPVLRGAGVLTGTFGGGGCPAGVCPEYYSCRCDAAGRVTFQENTYAAVSRDRSWIAYDAAGKRTEVHRDLDADGRNDGRYLYARNADDSCVMETADEDLDGAVEQICRYDHDCIRGQLRCEPVSCASPPVTPQGTWCESKECPARARCSCDGAGRVVEALLNLDQDPAYEARLQRSYRGDSRLISEEVRYDRGQVSTRQTWVRDERERVLQHRLEVSGSQVPESEELWTWGAGAEQWLTYESRVRGQPQLRRTRSYRDGDGALLQERIEPQGAGATLLLYLPGAPPDIVQPVSETPWWSLMQLRCRRDADCEIVSEVNCCGCSEGGSGVSVARKYAAQLRKQARQRCGARPTCPAVISTDPSCQSGVAPACEQGVCTLRWLVPLVPAGSPAP